MGEKSERAQKEEKILSFWKENKIFEKSLEKEAPKGEFVFYEGPPTANGRPGIHHLEARSFKDAIPRYKTMQGFSVPRRGGWDTHGLPVELEVEKQLGLKSKKEIEQFGIDKFNEECKRSVWKYVDEWKDFTARTGYWVDLKDAYVTYHNSYIEKVWSILAHVEERKLLYKDYKVLPWCPRCGTALSSHELAQGYKDVKDLSVYAKFKIIGFENAYFLAWTTTPWTLPGNVALAVGEDIDYVEIKIGEEILVLAKERLSVITEPYEIVAEHKGKEMVGMEYEPLYPYLKDNFKGTGMDKAYKVYVAKFVTTTDGTGIVHTAVMYGQDDFELGTEIGLPKFHLVDETGKFKKETGEFAGRFVKDEEVAVDIIKYLAHRGLLYKKEKHEHSYPFCWRCKTPLIYYARDSWYIAMSNLRDELVKENEKINWEPEYIKEGRFGEWLREIKDWAISRERYWGTPLPVWQNAEAKRIVVDSISTLKKYSKKSGNNYLVMRHGGTEGNKKELVSYKDEADDHLTEEGKEGVKTSAQNLRGKNIDFIVYSPFARTAETAKIVGETLGLPGESLIADKRLKEIDPGEYDGKDWFGYHKFISEMGENWFNEPVKGGESFADVRKRVGEFIYELENKYKNKNILIVTHGGPAWILYVLSGEYSVENKNYKLPEQHGVHTEIFVETFKRFENAEVREFDFAPLPHNKDFELDLHKPYIDEVILEKDGEEYRRVKEVMDVWFDSGSMPFAQDPENFVYPADFISEAIDQTRGWFYTLHAIGILMEKGHAYKNVICLGHILDKEGKKMSKSVGNVVNPWEMIDKYGVDTLRLWMYSVNQPGESKNFDERSVDELQKRLFNLLDNVYSFYELYRDRSLENDQPRFERLNVLDKWILSRLSDIIDGMTNSLEAYRLLEPVRNLREFIGDLSVWYVRRSRERLKDGDEDAKKVLHLVLVNVAKLMAPFAPFAAEDLYQKLKSVSDPESVHLEKWPTAELYDASVEKLMEETRRLVSAALEQRSKANIKVRQPLAELKIKNKDLSAEYLDIIKDELNVKKVTVDESLPTDVELDTNITAELQEEGRMRDSVRAIQEWRKEKGLKPGEKAVYEVPEAEKEVFAKFAEEIKKITNVEF